MLHDVRTWAVLALLAAPAQALATQVCHHSAYAAELAVLPSIGPAGFIGAAVTVGDAGGGIHLSGRR